MEAGRRLEGPVGPISSRGSGARGVRAAAAAPEAALVRKRQQSHVDRRAAGAVAGPRSPGADRPHHHDHARPGRGQPGRRFTHGWPRGGAAPDRPATGQVLGVQAHAGRDGRQRAALGPRGRPLRQQAPRPSVPWRLCGHEGRDGVRDGRLDLQPVADDAGIAEQARPVIEALRQEGFFVTRIVEKRRPFNPFVFVERLFSRPRPRDAGRTGARGGTAAPGRCRCSGAARSRPRARPRADPA